MNDPKNKVALGVDPSRNFEACSTEINQAFMYQGDGMHNSALLLPELIEDGVRLLVYAGNAGEELFTLIVAGDSIVDRPHISGLIDMMCNYIVRLTEGLPSHAEHDTLLPLGKRGLD
jgi:hypothetical protein